MDEQDTVVAATETSLAAAQHLTELDAGAVQALRMLAEKIDTELEHRRLALEWAEENEAKPPPVDNVSIPTYLKYCESLGLTPAGRTRLAEKKGPSVGGKIGGLRAGVPRPK